MLILLSHVALVSVLLWSLSSELCVVWTHPKIIATNGRGKGKKTVDLPNKPVTVHCIIQMHCPLLIPHKLCKQNTQTDYQLPQSQGKSWLSRSHPSGIDVTTGTVS